LAWNRASNREFLARSDASTIGRWLGTCAVVAQTKIWRRTRQFNGHQEKTAVQQDRFDTQEEGFNVYGELHGFTLLGTAVDSSRDNPWDVMFDLHGRESRLVENRIEKRAPNGFFILSANLEGIIRA